MKKIILILTIYTVIVQFSIAISQPNTNLYKVPSSPDAAAFQRYGEVPIEYSTGVPNINIPIGNIMQDEVTQSISLSYHAGGINIGESASWVGQNWNLNAGGIVSVIKNGGKDDGVYGYLNTYDYIETSTGTFLDDTNLTSLWKNEISDSEPDFYHYNFNGHSGKFLIDTSYNVFMVPRSDLKVQIIKNGSSLGGFIILTTDGTKYYFGRTQNGSENIYEYTQNPQGASEITAFYLVKTESANGKHSLTYTYSVNSYTFRAPCTEVAYATDLGVISYPANVINCYNDIYINSKVLSTITNSSGTTTINFNSASSPRTDLAGGIAKRLENISINNGIECKTFNLFHSYFADGSSGTLGTTRLKLDSLKESSCNSSIILPPTKFEYYGNFIAKTYSRSIDHWGFYNAGSNDNVDINIPDEPNALFNGGNREADTLVAKYGTIKKITYPTKGSVEFIFESNSGLYVTYELDEQLRNMKSCFPTNPSLCCNTTIKQDTITFQSTEQIENAFFELSMNYSEPVCSACNNIQNPSSILIELYNGSILIGSTSFNVNSTCGSSDNPTFPLANMFNNTSLNQNQPIEPGIKYIFKLTTGKGIGEFKLFTKQPVNNNRTVGGLRIKRIISYDGISSNNNIIKNYEYPHPSVANVSSGTIKWIPKYHFFTWYWPSDFLDPPYNSKMNIEYLVSQPKLANSSLRSGFISYSKVIEKIQGIGKKDMTFYVGNYIQNIDLQLPNEIDELEGKMKSELIYNEAGLLLKETQYRTSNSLYMKDTFDLLCIKRLKAPGGTGALNGNWPVFYKVITKAPYLIDTIITTFDGVQAKEILSYDNLGRVFSPIAKEFTNSDGKVYRTEYSYPYLFTSNNTINQLFKKNIKVPVLVQQKVNNTLVDGSKTVYKLYGTFPYMDSIYRYKTTWNSSNTHIIDGWKFEQKINTIDTFLGKPTSIKVDGWNNITLEWFAGTALLKKQTFNSHIKNFEYHTGYGFIKRITDIDGQFMDFTFDQLGRLYRKLSRPNIAIPDPAITANYNNYIEYSYHYKNTSTDYNWLGVKTFHAASPGVTARTLEAKQFLDGLGRPLQTVKKNQANGYHDLVVDAVEYDNKGRVIKKFTPFQSTSNTGNFFAIPGAQKYTSYTYEASPLNRVLTETPPDWLATTFAYGANAASVVKSSYGTSPAYYAANLLSKESQTDAYGRITEVYKDKKGRVILSRNTNMAGIEKADTYTEYDNKDRVKNVFPPDVNNTHVNLLFNYLYDGSDNMIYKKIPDQNAIDMVYNDMDLMTFYRDGNLTSSTFNENGIANQWMMTKYDIYGRPTGTGFYTSASTPAGNNSATSFTKQISWNTYGTSGIDFGKIKSNENLILGNYPNTTTKVSENYSYDVFGRLSAIVGNNHINTGTGNQLSYFTYDYMDNMLKDSTKQVTTAGTHSHVTRMTYDFLGRPANTYHKIIVGTTSNGEKHISSNAYNFRGELITKRLSEGSYAGPPTPGTTYLQKTDFTYNEMGWLTKINDPFLTGTLDPLNPDFFDAFRLNLNYNTAPITVTGQTPVLDLSGNISQLSWQNRNMDVQGYNFEYDYLSRLKFSKYFEVIGAATNGTYNAKYDENLTYDNRGNILSLSRNTQNGAGNTLIDNLTYSYLSNTNKINTIVDATANINGFNQNGASSGYSYDNNGNTRTNPYKKITETKYYFNNLPKDITVNLGASNVNKIRFTYDASGRKLRKQVLNNANTITFQQDYFGKIEYTGTTPVVEAIYHPEGRAVWNGTTWRYEFNVTDHLGNIRAVISDIDNDKMLDITTSATTNEIINVNSYYPFGMLMAGTYSNNTTTPDTRYQYNGKEYNSDLGLNLLDYGARWYDAAIGRFSSVDPLADKNNFESPYVYVHNNPLKYIDPDGRDGILVVFPNYKVDTETRLGKQPLGHAGVLLIDNKTGLTKYYEYGRYDTKDGTKGRVRTISVSNVKIGEDGKPTQESLNKVLGQISKKSGQGGKIEGAYVEGDFTKMNDYAQEKLKESNPQYKDYDKEREPYSLTGNNCATFGCDVLKQDPDAKKNAPWIFNPTPNNVANEYQDNFPKVSYDPKTKITTSDIYKKED